MTYILRHHQTNGGEGQLDIYRQLKILDQIRAQGKTGASI